MVQKWSEDQRKVIYLTSNQPLQFSSNTWFYKMMPSMNQWLEDINATTSSYSTGLESSFVLLSGK